MKDVAKVRPPETEVKGGNPVRESRGCLGVIVAVVVVVVLCLTSCTVTNHTQRVEYFNQATANAYNVAPREVVRVIDYGYYREEVVIPSAKPTTTAWWFVLPFIVGGLFIGSTL